MFPSSLRLSGVADLAVAELVAGVCHIVPWFGEQSAWTCPDVKHTLLSLRVLYLPFPSLPLLLLPHTPQLEVIWQVS